MAIIRCIVKIQYIIHPHREQGVFWAEGLSNTQIEAVYVGVGNIILLLQFDKLYAHVQYLTSFNDQSHRLHQLYKSRIYPDMWRMTFFVYS